jgi:hypothetical protein
MAFQTILCYDDAKNVTPPATLTPPAQGLLVVTTGVLNFHTVAGSVVTITSAAAGMEIHVPIASVDASTTAVVLALYGPYLNRWSSGSPTGG